VPQSREHGFSLQQYQALKKELARLKLLFLNQKRLDDAQLHSRTLSRIEHTSVQGTGNLVLEMKEYLTDMSQDLKHGPELRNTFKMLPILSRSKQKRPTTQQLSEMNKTR
jgi:hypothetical protein